MAELYEVEVDGETYEVESDSQEAAVAAARGMHYTAGRQQEAAGIRAGQKSMTQKTLKGAVEGGRRIIVDNAQQAAAALGEAVGVLPQGAVQSQTQNMMANRFEATQGDPDVEQAADISEGVLSAVPGLSAARALGVLPKLKTAETVGRTLAQASRAGAAVAATAGASETAETPADVLASRAIAGGLAMGLQGSVALAVGAKPLVQNYLTRLRSNADQSVATLEAQKHGLLDVGKLSLSQQSGNIVARNLEVQAYATRAQNFFVDQFKRFADATEGAVASIRRAATSPNPDDLATAWKVHKAWGARKAAAQQAASREYGGHIAKALNLAGKDAAKYPLPVDNLAEVTAKWTAETGGQPWWRKIHPGADKMSAEFQTLDDYLKRIAAWNAQLNNPAGTLAKGQPKIGKAFEGISVQEMIMARRALSMEDQMYWRAVNSGKDPTPAQFDTHRAVREMMDAIDKDLDGYLAKADPNLPSVQAITVLRDANAKYAQFKDVEDFMSNTTAAQYFGGRISDDPGKALAELASRSPAQQTIIVNALRSYGHGSLEDLRAGLVNRALRAMVDPARDASRGLVDPEKFAKAMTGEYGTVGAQIFEPAQLAQIHKALATVRVLQNGPEGVVSVSRAPSVESTAMALISQSRAFLTRAFIRISTLGKVEDLLFSQEGLKSLEVLRSANAGTWRGPANEVTKAITKIGAVASQGEIPDEYVTSGQ